MKRIALFSVVLALGLIIVQPLQAETLAYTIQGSLVPLYSNDPLGIGSGSATATFNFTLVPPATSTSTTTNASVAIYTPVNTLSLSGTNADGAYTLANSEVELFNFFSNYVGSYPNDNFDFDAQLQLSGRSYDISMGMSGLPLSFWGDGEVPPLPKLISNSDGGPHGNIGEDMIGTEYYIDNITISSQVVPVPPTVWLLGSGLLGLIGVKRFRKN